MQWSYLRAMAAAAVGVVVCLAGCANQEQTTTDSISVSTQEPGTVTIQDNMSVKIDYTLTVDGEVVDSSDGKEPLGYVHGQRQIIPGLEKQLAGHRVGDHLEVIVEPEQGYGPINSEAVVQVPRAQLPEGIEPSIGDVLGLQDPQGRPWPGRVLALDDETVTLDLNHPLAGKTLHFDVTVVDITSTG